MVSKQSRVVIAFCVVLAVLVLSQGAVAQNYWMRPATEKSISLDFFKASYNDVEGLDFFTSVVCLSGYIPVNDRLTFVFDFPTSHLNSDYYNQSLFGNPYVGIEMSTSGAGESQSFIGRLGLRPPLASDERYTAAVFGAYAMMDRMESFLPDLWTFSAGFGYQHRTENQVSVGFDFTGELMVPTADGWEDAELYIDYDFGLWYRPETAKLGVGLAGRMLATESDMDFGERTVHQLGFFAGYDGGAFEPGFHFRVPLDDDLRDVVNFLWGVNLTWAFE